MEDTRIITAALTKLGLSALAEAFKDEKIEAGMVAALSDAELTRLGLATIGSRFRFRKTVAEMMNMPSTSQVDQSESHEPDNLRTQIRQERSQLFGSFNASRSRPAVNRNKRKSIRTLTMQFVCLADTNQQHVPNSVEKNILNKAGLGTKKIVLSRDATETEVFQRIMSDEINTETQSTVGFPQLREVGGFELLRCAPNCRSLKAIDCGWKVSDIRKCVNPQTNLYIRPIQKNLSTKSQYDSKTCGNTIKMPCAECKIEFPLRDLRSHLEVCGSAGVLQTATTSDSTSRLSDSEADVNAATTDQDTHSYGAVSEQLATSASAVNDQPPSTSTVSEQLAPSTSAVSEQLAPSTSAVSEQLAPSTSAFSEQLAPSTSAVSEQRPSSVTDNNLNTAFILDSGNTYFVVQEADTEMTLQDVILNCIKEVQEFRITDPIQCLQYIQQQIVTGRKLDIGPDDIESGISGATNFIIVDRTNILADALDEVSCLTNLRLTLEVDFAGELIHALPFLIHLLTPVETPLTFKNISRLLQPVFSPDGSNRRTVETVIYQRFIKYLREVAGGRRGAISLGNVLQFVTGTEEEPPLGFAVQPSISFDVRVSYLPTANTCINKLQLTLPDGNDANDVPDNAELYRLYDYAFCNNYFGLA